MSVDIRPARPQDKARCLQLLQALSSATGNEHSMDAGAAFDTLLTTERGLILVAGEGETILGMASISFNIAMRYAGEYCQLEELIVDPAARGKNVGGLLVEAAVHAARERGCGEFGLYLLESTQHNRPFYEKYGFEVIGSEMRQRLR